MIRNPSCDLCALSTGDVKHICMEGRWVGGESDVIVLGQSPGQQEDNSGMPFVGPSGELLKDALKGLDHYYLTNTVKCFVPAGKVMDPLWAKACRIYWLAEVEAIKPRWILALGNESVQATLGRRNVTSIAGKIFHSDTLNAEVFVTLHPAAILRDRGREAGWRLDLASFVRHVKGTNSATPPVTWRLVVA